MATDTEESRLGPIMPLDVSVSLNKAIDLLEADMRLLLEQQPIEGAGLIHDLNRLIKRLRRAGQRALWTKFEPREC